MKKNSTRFFQMLLLLFLVAPLISTAPVEKPSNTVKWMTFEEAMKANESNPKKIFIDIYTDWCGWCKKMDAQTFNHPQIAQYMNENFYNIKFNAEQKEEIEFNGHTFKFIPNGSRGVHELAVALTNNKLSYPMSIFMDEELRILSPLPGFQKANFFDSVLKYFGEEHHKKTKWEDFQKGYTSNIGD